MFSALLVLTAVLQFVVLVAVQAIGRVVGRRRLRREHDEAAVKGFAVEGALFGLLGLMMAFSFSGAQDRLDARRHLILEEANDMSTAYLRVDLLPPARQPAVRELFRQYADARIAYYKTIVSDRRVAIVQHDRALQLQGQLWSEVVAGLSPSYSTANVVLPPFNAMFDVTTARDLALHTHLPITVFILLETLSIACAFFAGLDLGRAGNLGWMHIVAFAAGLSVTIYVIADVEFPRAGISQVAHADAELLRVRAGM